MEIIAILLIIVAPIYAMLFNIQKRLSRIEPKVEYLWKNNGGEKE